MKRPDWRLGIIVFILIFAFLVLCYALMWIAAEKGAEKNYYHFKTQRYYELVYIIPETKPQATLCICRVFLLY